MALHTPNNQAQAAQQAAQQQTTQQGQRMSTPQQSQPQSSFGMPSQLVGMGSGGETFEKIYSKIVAEVKRLNDDKVSKISVCKLLKHTAGLNYSAIIVAETAEGITAAHALIIEKTGSYPERISDSYNNLRYEIVRTPADALDVKYINATQACVANYLKVAKDTVIVVDGTLVVNEFDAENEGSVQELLDNTLKATHSEVAIRAYDYRGTNLQEFIAQNKSGKFVVNLHFNSDDAVYLDQTGMPVRQDICVVLSYKTGGNNFSRSVNQGDDSVEIVRTYGYIDFEFTGAQMYNNTMSTQKFVPNFIITHIQSATTPTPEIVMLGVVSVMSLNEDMNWLQAFRPTVTRKDMTDHNDVGALNVEGNIEMSPTGFGKRYDIKSKGATVEELNRLIQTLSRPTMMVSIDIPKAGPETWYTSLFHYIGEQKSADAYKRLTDFLSYATGGVYASQGEAIFTDSMNKIHGGFYKTKDGYRDIRHLACYLGVANHVVDTNQPNQLVAQYTNTLYNTVVPAELRAATRREYIDSMSNKTAVYKQMYERRTFSAIFLAKWLGSLRAIGFDPVYSNSAAVNDMFVKRATANFQGAILNQDTRLMTTSNSMYNGWNAPGNYTRMF